jgi:hypothetical protein
MMEWIRLWFKKAVVRRVFLTALVVGAFLVAINNGDAILHGQVDAVRWLRISLTVLVPYVVSTVSSVQAMQDSQKSSLNRVRKRDHMASYEWYEIKDPRRLTCHSPTCRSRSC